MSLVLIERAGAIATFTINRPNVLNALNNEVIKEIAQGLEELKKDKTIEVIIFTGSGNKAFAAGADIDELNQTSALEILDSEFHDVFNRIDQYPKVTIAAINGFALGGGCELALACDIRIAHEKAKLGLPELNLGIVPGAGGTQRLLEHIGLGNALYYVLTGEQITAQRAFDMNLVSKVTDGDVLAEAKELANTILTKGPTAIRLVKQLMKAKMIEQSQNTLQLEKFAQAILFNTSEKEEGTRAFLEKRKANFRGVEKGVESDVF